MYITNDVKYIGVNDYKIDFFEGQYPAPNGMAYNSYVILDEKIAVMDSVEAGFGTQWLANLKMVIGDKAPDYLVVHHMEPDHSANIHNFMQKYPDTKIVASAKAFAVMKNFFGTDYPDNQIAVGDGDSLSLGRHNLTFITAPMVHWPEVIMTYDSTDKILFSADAFGKFGTLDVEEEWLSEARRYYIGIVGKYGVQVQNMLKKLSGFDIQKICSLHGPVLVENADYYINKYNVWSSYKAEEKGVVIAYTSVYGNIKKAVMQLERTLLDNGVEVKVHDILREDWTTAVGDAFCYDKLVLATTTYNGDIFPAMKQYIQHLTERNFSNRKVAFIESGSWAPVAVKIMKAMLEKSKNLIFAQNDVKILSALDETSTAQLNALAEELATDTI